MRSCRQAKVPRCLARRKTSSSGCLLAYKVWIRGAGCPEATSHQVACRIKHQFAVRSVQLPFCFAVWRSKPFKFAIACGLPTGAITFISDGELPLRCDTNQVAGGSSLVGEQLPVHIHQDYRRDGVSGRGQKLYLSPIRDLYNGEIIAFKTARRPLFDMVGAMLRQAFEKSWGYAFRS